MSYQVSKNLGALLDQYRDDTPIDLKVLADQVAGLFGKNMETVKSLLNGATGAMSPGTVWRHLFDGIAHDSVVRDVFTVGHLAKLLSRLDVLTKASYPMVVCLPNSIFDEQSQLERAEFFAAGNILPIDAEILANDAVKEMLDREKEKMSERSIQNGA